MTTQQRLLMRGVALSVAALLLGVIALGLWRGRHPVPHVVVSGTADIGGPFAFTAASGERVASESLRGKTIVLYHGWRLDPDVTPAALQVLAAALERVDPKSSPIAAYFLSLDPARDGPKEVAEFVGKISSRLRGGTLLDAQLSTHGKQFKLYFKRLPDTSLPGGYSIDHASLYYVLGKDGMFRGIVPHTTDVAALATELTRLSR